MWSGARLRRRVRRWRDRRALHRSPLRVIIGSAGTSQPGWVATERYSLDLLDPADWTIFEKNPADAFLAEHVWEHLTLKDGLAAAVRCFDALNAGGHLRIAVPDGGKPDAVWQAAAGPGGSWPGADDHKVLYSLLTLSALLERAGFRVEPLEYFDAAGQFRHCEWEPSDGFIRRSFRYDERNSAADLPCPSLIVDAWK